MTKSVSDVERELMKLNMSDMEKKMFDLQMTYPGQDIGRLAAAEMTMFTHKISEDFMKAQGEDPDLERQIRDIQNFFSGTDDEKSRIIGHMEWQRFDKKLQNRLSEIKDIDTEFGYAPAINLEWKIEDENLKNRFENLKKISEEEYQWLKKRNDQLKDFKLTNIDINKNLFIEEYRSQDAGYMTNREADLRVQQQYMSMLLKIAEATKGLSDTEKNAIQTMIKQRIEREQNTKQLESVVSAYANANNILGQLSDPDSDIAKEKLSEIKTDGLIKLFPNIDPELARKKVRESLGLDWSAEKEFSEISKIGGQLPTLSKKHGEIVYLSNLGLINERYKENIKIAEEAKKRVGEFYSEELKEMSKLIKAEEEYQLKLRMRKHLSKEEDIRVGFEEGFRAIREQSMTTGEMIGTSISSGFDHAANAMGDFVTGTKSASEAFRGMAVSIISDLTRMMIKQQMMNLLVGQGYASGETSAAGGLLGAIGSGIMDIFGVGVGSPTMNLGGVNLGTAIRMADGGVFSNISGHSNNIVNRTTPFEYSGLHKFATGAGIMGEAGPEAIVPLTRMPSGNLGVEAKTTAPKIKINITNNNVSNDVTASQDESPKWNGEEWVIGVVLEHAANNKKNFRTSMKGMLNR
jgi:lambda family phage tail tape measure protein